MIVAVRTGYVHQVFRTVLTASIGMLVNAHRYCQSLKILFPKPISRRHFHDNEDGEQVEHYGNMESAVILPRVGELASFLDKERTFEVTRIVHESKEYQTPFSIGYVAKIYGKEVSFEPRR